MHFFYCVKTGKAGKTYAFPAFPVFKGFMGGTVLISFFPRRRFPGQART